MIPCRDTISDDGGWNDGAAMQMAAITERRPRWSAPKSEGQALRALLPDLLAGRMPSAEAIADADAAVKRTDKARAEMIEAGKPMTAEELSAGLTSGALHIALTLPQWRELKAMTDEPQHTFGKHRAAVQNRLVTMTLATFGEDDKIDICSITEAGRKVLAANTAAGGGFRPDKPETP